MDTEEILIKLGFRSDALSAEGRKLADELDKLGKKSEAAFISAESKSRTFNKVMNQITAESPLMGAALNAAMSPIVGIMLAIVAGTKMVLKAFEDADKFTERMAEKEAKHQMAVQEAAAKAADAVHKRQEAHEEFEAKADKARKSAREQAEYESKISSARESSGGDEGEFLRKKRIIDLEEKARAEAKLKDAEEKERASERFADSQAQEMAGERLKRSVKDVAAEEEKARKELAILESHSPIEVGGTPLFAGGIEHQKKIIEAQNKVHALREQREMIESTLREADDRENKRKSEQKEAQADILKAPGDLSRINKELAEDEKKIREQERKEKAEAVKQEIEESQAAHKHDEVAFLKEKIAIEETARAEAEAAKDKKQALEYERQLRKDNISLIEAEKDKAIAQKHLDREIAQTKKHRIESERQPYLPTLQELANSMPWRSDARFDAVKDMDKVKIGAGMAYGQKFAGDAQELERLKDEAKRALFVEGPDSTRFKEDLKKIDSLKKGLATAGLQTSDDRLQSIDDHMRDLVERAAKEGLVVQPVNGP